MTLETLRPEERARALLLRQRIARLPVDVTKLRFDRPLLVDSLQHYCSLTASTVEALSCGTDYLRDGCTLIRRMQGAAVFLVLYNEAARNKKRRSFTLAHEVGHILLEHREDGDTEEREADRFARELLVPRVLALACLEGAAGPSPELLADVFGVSKAMAKVRLATLGEGEAFSDGEVRLLRRYRSLLPAPGRPALL